jgi:hypothetical protein
MLIGCSKPNGRWCKKNRWLLALMVIGMFPIGSTQAWGDSPRLGAFQVGGMMGLAVTSKATGIRMSGEGEYAFRQLGPRLYLDFAGHIAATLGAGFTVLEIVPLPRLKYCWDSQWSFYADSGLGIAATHGMGRNAGGVFRIGMGFRYQVDPKIVFRAEPMGANIYLGGNRPYFTMTAGAMVGL